MSAAAATMPVEQGFNLMGAFQSAVSNTLNFAVDAVKGAASLTYDFVKANALLFAVGADLVLNGGGLTQQVLVAGTNAIAGAVGQIGLSAGSGLWDMITGSITGGASVPAPTLGGGGGW